LAPQVLLATVKSPVAVIVAIVKDALRPFVNVMICAAAVEPMVVLANVRLAGETVTGVTPVPERVTVCGLFAALSVNVNVPPAAPKAVGVNETPMVQVAPALMLAPQVSEATAKGPLATMLEKLSWIFSWFVNVIVLLALTFPMATLERLSVLAESVTGAMPVPVRLTDRGLLLALWVMVNVPVWAATAVGVNAMSRVQLVPPGKVAGFKGQVPPVCVKGPVRETLLIVRAKA
jgi:hypothetical protein